ncbi:MAG: HigA family addiction module antitoxin [Desulfatiglandaceae bacterium]
MGSESRNKYRPSRVFPPGDTLWETLEAMGMSQVELAARMGVTERRVRSVVKGKSPISEDTALRLERVLGIDAVFWRNLENLYRRHLAEQRDGKQPSRARGDGAAQGRS